MARCPVAGHSATPEQASNPENAEQAQPSRRGGCPVDHSASSAGKNSQPAQQGSVADSNGQSADKTTDTEEPVAVQAAEGGRCPYGYDAPKGPRLSPLHCAL